MENIYDIRIKEQLQYILPTTEYTKPINRETVGKTIVIICLYYPKLVDNYISYITNIPEEICVCIYSSSEETLSVAKEKIKRQNIQFNHKKNRGRDISALLIAAREQIRKYDFFCFIHDKSPNQKYLEQDVKLWSHNLWDNTLCNESYIYNVLQIFEKNPKIGLLAPPEPFGEFYSDYYDNSWRDDFENTKELAKKLGIEVDISYDKEVFILGTVFWARRAALEKLLDRKWTYEDFPEEPLPIDGTISHAIEKVLGYVAQDAGYKSGTIMTQEYASWLLLHSQEYMRKMFYHIKQKQHVLNMHQIDNLEQREKAIKQLFDKYKCIYIYGAGNYGINIYNFLQDRRLQPIGFVVSDNQRKQPSIVGLPIYEINEIGNKDDVGFLIAVSYEYRESVEKTLLAYGCTNFVYAY